MIAQKFTQPLSPAACQISPELENVQDLMPISAEDKQALRESIKRDGIREPLRGYWGKDESGKRVFFVLSGFNRLEIAQELNLATVPVEAVETDDREAFAIDENRARRQLDLDDKRRLAAWLLKRNPAMSNNQAGKLSGLDDKTAGKVRADLESRSEIPNAEKRTDSKGRNQPASKPKASKNTPSARTGKAQASSVKPGKVSGRDENLTGFPAVSAALVAIRREMPKLSRADKKRVKKELERLVAEADL